MTNTTPTEVPNGWDMHAQPDFETIYQYDMKETIFLNYDIFCENHVVRATKISPVGCNHSKIIKHARYNVFKQ